MLLLKQLPWHARIPNAPHLQIACDLYLVIKDPDISLTTIATGLHAAHTTII